MCQNIILYYYIIIIKPSLISYILSICGVARINTDQETLVQFLTYLPNRLEFDKFLYKARVIEEVSPDLHIGECVICECVV